MVRAAEIGDHAVIGDGRSAALVARDGTVDWLCWPRFDSPSVLAAVLDPDRGGHLALAPAGRFRATRRYLDETNVLATRLEVDTGVVELIDFMPVREEGAPAAAPRPAHELLRVASCLSGEVTLELAADLRPGYATARVLPRDAGRLGVRWEHGPHLYTLRATAPLALGGDGVARARVRLAAGEALQVSLAFDEDGPASLPPLGARVHAALAATVVTWRRWVARVPDDLPARAAVVRSALALKLLAFAPSGAIVAAPTTSLPERQGGALNWDYRYCWPRDAALTVNALRGLGFEDEAVRFASWLLHATRLTRPELRVLYDVHGEQPPVERALDHLRGHGGARPVRVGNAAADQQQLDVYGEVVHAVAQLAGEGRRLDRETQALLADFGRTVCERWEEPESGIWEPREAPRLHTHSLALAWTALDRLLALHAGGALRGIPADRFAANRKLLRERIEREGWSARAGSYVATLGGEEVDAALLLLPWFGYVDPAAPRMRATWRRVSGALGAGPGLLHRNLASAAAGEGAFGICSFWAAEYLARGGGTLAEARAWFEAACGHANDVGLFGEEIAPGTGAALGNFPQAFTHVGLVDAALAVARRERAERARPGAARAAGAAGAEARP